MQESARSPYLTGNYAPVENESEFPELTAIGTVPHDLAGAFLRNSPNPRYPAPGRYHWFDGDGMIHAVTFQDGRAAYRNRWIRTEGFLAEAREGRALWTGLLEPPDLSRAGGPYKNTSNTDLVYHNGRLLALWWLGGTPYELRCNDLETVGRYDYGGRLGGGMSAHAKVDPRTGELVFIDYGPVPPFLTLGTVSASGTEVVRAPIDLPGPRLQHDVGITENYAVVLDLSMFADPSHLPKQKVRFFRDVPSRLGVISRNELRSGAGVRPRWFDVDPCYIYHLVNCWEQGSELVVVGCRIANPLARDPSNPPSSRAIPTIANLRLEPTLHRWTLNLETGSVTEQQLDDLLTEFPRVDDSRQGLATRYSYHGLIAASEAFRFEGIVKYDLRTGASTRYHYPPGWFGGEVSFAPRPGASDEDDGYLLTFVVDETSFASELQIFAAKDLASGPIARLQIPVRVPTGFHSRWVGEHWLKRRG